MAGFDRNAHRARRSVLEGLRLSSRVSFRDFRFPRPGKNLLLPPSNGRRALSRTNPKGLLRSRTSVGRSVSPDLDRAKRSFAFPRPRAFRPQRCRVHALSARERSAPDCLYPGSNRVLPPSNSRRVIVDARCDAWFSFSCRTVARLLCLTSTRYRRLCIAVTLSHDLSVPGQSPDCQRRRDPWPRIRACCVMQAPMANRPPPSGTAPGWGTACAPPGVTPCLASPGVCAAGSCLPLIACTPRHASGRAWAGGARGAFIRRPFRGSLRIRKGRN